MSVVIEHPGVTGDPAPLLLECSKCAKTRTIQLKVQVGAVVSRVALPCDCGGEFVSRPGLSYAGQMIAGIAKTVLLNAARDDLERLADALQAARARPAVSADEVAAALEGTDTEAGRQLGQWIRENGGWIGIAALIVAILQSLQMLLATPAATPEQIEFAFEQALEETSAAVPTAGRNDPCPCKSGLKFKRCHGLPPSVQRNVQSKRQQSPSVVPPRAGRQGQD